MTAECRARGWVTPRMAVAARIYPKTNGRCYYCGVEVGESFDIEHMVPKSRGGSCHESNLVPSCKPCNVEKASRTIEEWRQAKMARAMMAKGTVPHFTARQLKWLETVGVHPYQNATRHVFWFEENPDKIQPLV